MLLAHGTTEIRADQIYDCGYFQKRTPFLKLEPDEKLAFFGTSGFAFRSDPIVDRFIEDYCKQDLFCKPWKSFLKKYAQDYVKSRKYDESPGLIFVVNVSEEDFDFPNRFLANWYVPTNVDSTKKIPTSAIEYIVTLKKYEEHFKKKYDARIETPLEELVIDPLLTRIKYNVSTRYNRIIWGKK